MKFTLSVFVFLILSLQLSAQDTSVERTNPVDSKEYGLGSIQLSAGLDFVMPIRDLRLLTEYGGGVSVIGEYGLTEDVSVTGKLGYFYMLPSSDFADFVNSMAMIQLSGGMKLHLEEVGRGFYWHPQIGISEFQATSEFEDFDGNTSTETSKETDLFFSFGAGHYFSEEKIDIGLYYSMNKLDEESLTPGFDFDLYTKWFGLRAAYSF